jgi:hypothetical protein
MRLGGGVRWSDVGRGRIGESVGICGGRIRQARGEVI